MNKQSKSPKQLPVDFVAPFSVKVCRSRLFDFAKRAEKKTNNWWNREYFDFHITREKEKQRISFQFTRHLNSVISVNATGYLIPKDEDHTHIIAKLHFGLDTYIATALIVFFGVMGIVSRKPQIAEVLIVIAVIGFIGWGIQGTKNTLKSTIERTLGFHIEEENQPIRELTEFE